MCACAQDEDKEWGIDYVVAERQHPRRGKEYLVKWGVGAPEPKPLHYVCKSLTSRDANRTCWTDGIRLLFYVCPPLSSPTRPALRRHLPRSEAD